MRRIKYFIGLSALILSAASFSEQGAGQVQAPPQPQSGGSAYPNPIGSNPNFDGNFFSNMKKSEAPPVPAGGRSGRSVGEEPDYNTAQRAEWLATCEPQKQVSMEAYRACYNEEKRRTQDRIRVRFKAVEDRLAGPSSPGVGGGNIGVPTVDTPAREPSSSDR